MITFTRRTGRNSFISAGPLITVSFWLLFGPLVFGIFALAVIYWALYKTAQFLLQRWGARAHQ